MAVENVATWPIKQGQCPSLEQGNVVILGLARPAPYTSRTRSASLQLIETWLTEQWFSSMDVQTHWQRAQAHNVDPIIGDRQLWPTKNNCLQICNRRALSNHWSKPMSKRANCCQVCLTKCQWSYRGTSCETHRSSHLLVTVSGEKGRGYGGKPR